MYSLFILSFILSWLLLVIMGIVLFFCKAAHTDPSKKSYILVLGLCTVISTIFPPFALIPILEFVR